MLSRCSVRGSAWCLVQPGRGPRRVGVVLLVQRGDGGRSSQAGRAGRRSVQGGVSAPALALASNTAELGGDGLREALPHHQRSSSSWGRLWAFQPAHLGPRAGALLPQHLPVSPRPSTPGTSSVLRAPGPPPHSPAVRERRKPAAPRRCPLLGNLPPAWRGGKAPGRRASFLSRVASLSVSGSADGQGAHTRHLLFLTTGR